MLGEEGTTLQVLCLNGQGQNPAWTVLSVPYSLDIGENQSALEVISGVWSEGLKSTNLDSLECRVQGAGVGSKSQEMTEKAE